MYSEHLIFPKLEDDNAILWRYMDYPKFFSLLEEGMYFSRLDNLGDPCEGALLTSKEVDDAVKKDLKTTFGEYTGQKSPDLDLPPNLDYGKYPEIYRKVTYVCCFHLNKHESCHMWLKFLNGNYGVAIRTTVSKLKNCFHYDDAYKVHLTQVKYKDVEDKKLKQLLEIVYAKRIELIDENEVRVIILPNELLQKCNPHPNSKSIGDFDSPFGITVQIDLDILIDSIVVSPDTPEWMCNCLNECLKKHNINKKVERSNLKN